MSTRSLLIAASFIFVGTTALAQGARFGEPISEVDVSVWNIEISPDGVNLPEGFGTAEAGEKVFVDKCQACHGEKGAGKPNDQLVGGFGTLTTPDKPGVKTVGSFWPYATTLFDYTRRAMPWTSPKSLSNSEVYAVTAYILALNGIISADQVMDAKTLPKVAMPNRDGFSPFPRNPR